MQYQGLLSFFSESFTLSGIMNKAGLCWTKAAIVCLPSPNQPSSGGADSKYFIGLLKAKIKGN